LLVHFLSVDKLRRVIDQEQPSWLDIPPQQSLLSIGPRSLSPIVLLRVLAIAFSRRLAQLASPGARTNGLAVQISTSVMVAAAAILYGLTY
jgi:hypothetical protein